VEFSTSNVIFGTGLPFKESSIAIGTQCAVQTSGFG
jgi:hypothetical protein